MPFAGYKNFDACVKANQDKEDPEAYCGTIKYKVEDKKESKKQQVIFTNVMGQTIFKVKK